LKFKDLEIIQGTGDQSGDALISIAKTNELLAIINGVDVNAIVDNLLWNWQNNVF
jgi:hypothetical protein